MTKVMISMLLLLSLGLSAKLVDNKSVEYEKACENGKTNACVSLGVLYFTGDGVEEDHKKAKRLFTKACKKSDSLGCYHLGTLYKRGGNDIERDFRKARMFYARGCKIGLAKSCSQYDLIREKREIKGSDINDNNFSYTYTPEIYGG